MAVLGEYLDRLGSEAPEIARMLDHVRAIDNAYEQARKAMGQIHEPVLEVANTAEVNANSLPRSSTSDW